MNRSSTAAPRRPLGLGSAGGRAGRPGVASGLGLAPPRARARPAMSYIALPVTAAADTHTRHAQGKRRRKMPPPPAAAAAYLETLTWPTLTPHDRRAQVTCVG
jgi:hypothetical protein